MMPKTIQPNQISQFEKAKLKQISQLLFDLNKNLIIGTLAYLLFEKWDKPINKAVTTLVGISSGLFFFYLGLEYLKRYMSKKSKNE